MSEPFSNWAQHAEWSDAARHFGRLMERLAGGGETLVGMLGALTVERMLAGHVCVDLRQMGGVAVFPDSVGGGLTLPATETVLTALRGCAVVGEPGAARPLILDAAGRLYLLRQWRDEQAVAEGIGARLHEAKRGFDATALAAAWWKHFALAGEVDWQQVAVFAALRNRFTVISGGPGTGKTRTIARLIALLREAEPDLRVALAAPTGKAAARLQEVLRAPSDETPPGAESQEGPEARTLHRLLGIVPGGGRAPRYDTGHPLPFDLVVLDEASMVDLAMMAALFRALPASARLVLVGDKDQLASVETGTVLSDVCLALGANRFSAEFGGAFQQITDSVLPAASGEGNAPDAVVQLQRNYRSDAAPDIAQLAEAVRDGDVPRVMELVSRLDGSGGVEMVFPAGREEWLGQLRSRLLIHARAANSAATPGERLEARARFRVLTPRREGFCGVRHLNELFEQALEEDVVRTARCTHSAGRPVMILENDYALRLFNGDTGVVVETPDGIRVAFPDEAAGGVRLLPLARLPRHETAHAMTIHKSQGSEFDEVLLVLPEANHPLLTRELVYTGLTRARRRVTVLAATGALERAAATSLRRGSGLMELLANKP